MVYIRPGIWLDDEGNAHFSVPELLDLVGLPHTQENFEKLAQLIESLAREKWPLVQIVRRGI